MKEEKMETGRVVERDRQGRGQCPGVVGGGGGRR